MGLETLPFDAAEHLAGAQAQAELLTDAFASGEPAYVAAALRTVARARASQDVDSAPAFPEGADPTLSVLLDTMRSLGMKLHVEPERRA